MLLWLVTAFILDKYPIANLKPDTRVLNSMVYSLLLVFILFRPRFIDEADFSYSINKFTPNQSLINAQDFDFLFYLNQYYCLFNFFRFFNPSNYNAFKNN